MPNNTVVQPDKKLIKYQILTSLPSTFSVEAIAKLEKHVATALKRGGQLAGGVSVVFGVPVSEPKLPRYEAYQAVLMPA
jgi:hypothetical protein